MLWGEKMIETSMVRRIKRERVKSTVRLLKPVFIPINTTGTAKNSTEETFVAIAIPEIVASR